MKEPEEWELISSLTFHDLRHDFAHRAREVGWTLEEVAYYLGHVTMKGLPTIQTTVRYTQVSRAQVKEKLKLLATWETVFSSFSLLLLLFGPSPFSFLSARRRLSNILRVGKAKQ